MTWTKWKIEKGQVVEDAVLEAVVAAQAVFRYTSPPGGPQIDISLFNHSNVPITVVVKR